MASIFHSVILILIIVLMLFPFFIEKFTGKRYFQLSYFLLTLLLLSTRKIAEVPSDDLIRYFGTYLDATTLGLSEYLTLTNREPVFQSYSWFIYQLFGSNLDIRSFSIISVMPSIFLLILLASKSSNAKSHSFILVSLLFSPSLLFVEMQLIRQSMAIYMLICSFFYMGYKKYLLLLMSVLTHYIVLPISILIFLITKIFNLASFRLYFLLCVVIFGYATSYIIGLYFHELSEVLSSSFFGGKFNFFTVAEKGSYPVGIMFIISIITFNVWFYFAVLERYKYGGGDSSDMPLVFLFYIMLCIILITHQYNIVVTRISPFFIGFSFFYIYKIMQYINLKGFKKVHVYITINFCLVLFFLLTLRNENGLSMFRYLYN